MLDVLVARSRHSHCLLWKVGEASPARDCALQLVGSTRPHNLCKTGNNIAIYVTGWITRQCTGCVDKLLHTSAKTATQTTCMRKCRESWNPDTPPRHCGSTAVPPLKIAALLMRSGVGHRPMRECLAKVSAVSALLFRPRQNGAVDTHPTKSTHVNSSKHKHVLLSLFFLFGS